MAFPSLEPESTLRSLDGSDSWTEVDELPSAPNIPLPAFRARAGRLAAVRPRRDSGTQVSMDLQMQSGDSWGGDRGAGVVPRENLSTSESATSDSEQRASGPDRNDQAVEPMSPITEESRDPWLQSDPWSRGRELLSGPDQRSGVYSSGDSERAGQAYADRHGGVARYWETNHTAWNENYEMRSNAENYDNRSMSNWSSWSSDSYDHRSNPNWSWWPQPREAAPGHDQGLAYDKDNRPSGEQPKGNPSVAGNSSSAAAAGKLSSSYPPIFYARPGESWEQYWRSVTFWVASEGKALPCEMRGPRLMQQLRERAGKIVQHLTVDEVAGENGLDIIRRTMEKSPIIKLLDQKKVDQRRQKFMRLSRLPQESVESFLNRAEIYRRENQSSPAYQVGSKFYVGHLLDAAKLTKRDLALIKAAAGGTLEEEDAVTNALLDLSEQLEGLPGCPIGRGEPTLDQEDKYLVQKLGPQAATTSPTTTPPLFKRSAPRGRRFFGGRRRVRDALLAILEDEDQLEDPDIDEDFLQDFVNGAPDDPMDEDEEDMTEFAGFQGVLETSTSPTATTQPPATPDTKATDMGMAEIFAQEYKARNRVREIKKMRQYFQREGQNGQQGGPGAVRDREHVKRWVKEQQKTEPCFICRQLGHWSQECPYRNKAPIHATNVTFQNHAPEDQDWSFLQQCAQSDARYKGRRAGQVRTTYMVESVHGMGDICREVYWSMKELGDKIILDLGCMKTVAGTTWVNAMVRKWKALGHYVKVVPENESFRFGDGHVNQSKFAVILNVLGMTVDTEHHTVTSRRYGVRAYGLVQSQGGHYLLDIAEPPRAVPSDFVMPSHAEVHPLPAVGSSTEMSDDLETTPNSNLVTAPLLDHGEQLDMGGSGFGRDGVRRGREPRGSVERSQSSQTQGGSQACQTRRTDGAAQDLLVTSQEAQGDRLGAEGDAADYGHDEGADGDDAGPDDQDEFSQIITGAIGVGRPGGSSVDGGAEDREGRRSQDQEEIHGQAQQACGIDRSRSPFSNIEQPLLRGPHLQHHEQLGVAGDYVQVEASVAAYASEAGGGTVRPPSTMAQEPQMDSGHARQVHRRIMGPHGSRQAALLEPKTVSFGTAGGRDCGDLHADVGQGEGEAPPEVTDPNAPTSREQTRRALDRMAVVIPADREDDLKECLHAGPREDDPVCHGDPHGGEPQPAGGKKITLNRRQTRSLRQGVRRALSTHQRSLSIQGLINTNPRGD
eukprot:Skav227763  [mRNA]  locus=scaffold1653:278465:286339:- [translate_table: standard]